MDRSELNRLLAKAIAHKNCGNVELARSYARELMRMLELEDLLVPELRVLSRPL